MLANTKPEPFFSLKLEPNLIVVKSSSALFRTTLKTLYRPRYLNQTTAKKFFFKRLGLGISTVYRLSIFSPRIVQNDILQSEGFFSL